jgi:hypothetical protein
MTKPYSCQCGACEPEDFRSSEPRRCKKCRRAYNKRRHDELKPNPTKQRAGRAGGLVGGRSRSAAKVAAARANGRLGGRPVKQKPRA